VAALPVRTCVEEALARSRRTAATLDPLPSCAVCQACGLLQLAFDLLGSGLAPPGTSAGSDADAAKVTPTAAVGRTFVFALGERCCHSGANVAVALRFALDDAVVISIPSN